MSYDIQKLDSSHYHLLENFLVNSLFSSTRMLCNFRSGGIDYNDSPYSATYVASFSNSEIISVAAHYGYGGIIIEATDFSQSLLSTLLRFSKRPVNSLMGNLNAINKSKSLLRLSNENIQHHEDSNLYHLALNNLILPITLLNEQLNFRKLNHSDLELYAHWMAGYMHATLNAPKQRQLNSDLIKLVEQALKDNNTWILELNNRPVSTASIIAQTTEVLSVARVWTPLHYRSRNYARTLLAAMLFDGWSQRIPNASLFTANSNIAAQKSYESLGFQKVGAYGLTILKQPLKFEL